MSDDERAFQGAVRSYRTLTRACPGEWLDADGNPYDRDSRADLALEIADRYLAEHPADDGEPVTAEWLRAAGFVEPANNDAWIRARATGFDVALAVRRDLSEFQLCSPTYDYDNVTIEPLPTRGHVRRLCAALGIPLRGVV